MYILCIAVVGKGGGVLHGLSYYFSRFHHFPYSKVIIGLKFNIRNMSRVTMLKYIIFYKKGLVIMYKSCLNRLILSLQSSNSYQGTKDLVPLFKNSPRKVLDHL